MWRITNHWGAKNFSAVLSMTINWNLAGRARSQCVTVLSVVRSAPAAARNGTGQFSVLNDKFQFDVLLLYADSHNSDWSECSKENAAYVQTAQILERKIRINWGLTGTARLCYNSRRNKYFNVLLFDQAWVLNLESHFWIAILGSHALFLSPGFLSLILRYP